MRIEIGLSWLKMASFVYIVEDLQVYQKKSREFLDQLNNY